MARSVSGLAEKPAPTKTKNASDAAADSASAEPTRVGINLAPMLAPYKKQGRFSLRIERLPKGARLSNGRRNGDGTWSLGSDEIDELSCLIPEGAEANPLLIRIISLDRNAGNTLAALDYPIALGDAPPPSRADAAPVAAPVKKGLSDSADTAQLQRLRDDLAKIRGTLAAREAELAQALYDRDQATAEAGKVDLAAERAAWDVELRERLATVAADTAQVRDDLKKTKATLATRERDLAQALHERDEAKAQVGQVDVSAERAAWEAESRKQLTSVRAQAELQLREARATWEAEEASRSKQLDAHTQARLTEAHAGWQRQFDEAIAKSQSEWKAEEKARFATAETRWREEFAAAVAEARTESKTGRSAQYEQELAQLRAALAAVGAEREAAEAQATRALSEARSNWEREGAEALTRVQQGWKAEEAARTLAVQTEWQAKLARATAEASAQAQAAHNETSDARVQELSEHAAALESKLASVGAERDAAIARASTSLAEAQHRWDQESAEALARAEQSWKANEATRAVTVQSEWQAKLARAVSDANAQAQAARSESDDARVRQLSEQALALEAKIAEQAEALARSNAAVEAARASGSHDVEAALKQAADQWRAESDARVQQLTEQAASLENKVAEHAEALARARAALEQARTQSARDGEITLKQAEDRWHAEEVAHIAAAEATARHQVAAELAEARSRFEAAEAALADIRTRAKGSDGEVRHLQEEISLLRATVADRDNEIAQSRTLTERTREPLFNPNPGERSVRRMQVIRPRSTAGAMLRDIAIASAVGASAIIFYPSYEMHLPQSLRVGIRSATNDLNVALGVPPAAHSTAVAEVDAVLAAVTQAPLEEMATLLKDANVRADASGGSAIVGRLPRGREVAILERQANWVRVRLDSDTGEATQGWVHKTMIKDPSVP